MKINHNLSAVVANNKLHKNEDIVAGSMERLASGIRINHAKDDPSGMAISNRLTTQIDGIDRASQNSSDAAAMIETADGGLNEITNILQRMRELAVQAANDTNTTSDREAIQKEIAELKEEINRMSRDTEFNTKGLFDGTLDGRYYPTKHKQDTFGNYVPDLTRIAVSDAVSAGEYKMTITPGSQAKLTGSPFALDKTSTNLIGETNAGSVSINGYLIEINANDTEAATFLKIQEAAEKGETTLDDTTGTLTSKYYGSQQNLEVIISNPNLANLLGNLNNGSYVAGTDTKVVPDTTSMFDNTVSVATDGNHVKIHQPGGFEIEFLANEQLDTNTDASLNVTTKGALQIQIGANENQTAKMRIPKINLETLYLDDLDVTTVNGSSRALGKLDSALNKVNGIRAQIGAYENRLDHAVSSLDQTSENLTKAFSGISDVDMAEEMTKYTQYNVLVQASTSVLAQANDLPEMVLQLLQ